MEERARRGVLWAGLATWIAALAAVSVSRGTLAGAEAEVRGHIVSETAGGFFTDVGSAQGVRAGASGTIERGGQEVARVEVAAVAPSSSLLRVLSTLGGGPPRVGDAVRLAADREPAAPGAEGKSPAVKEPGAGPEEFVPLLAPPPAEAAAPAEPSNIFHGRLWARQLFQTESKTSQDFSLTRAGTSGSLERIEGTPWAFEWSGAASYRDGHAFQGSRDYQEVRPDLFRLAFSRRFEAGGMMRLGRFLPQELPAIGYIDGAQGEARLGEHWRLGAVAGLKPTRRDLDVSTDEPTASGYATFEAGRPGALYYSGTAGVLGSMYRGQLDRLALLLDQRAALGPKLSLYSTTEADVDVGAAETRNDALRLTREDLFAVSPVASFLTLRAGLDHYERPDTRAERDVLRIEDDRLFDRGYWRYWAGGTVFAPWSLELDAEAAYIEAPDDDGIRWQAGVARRGLPGWRDAQARLLVFNLDGAGASGYGGRASMYLPLFGGDLSLEPSAGFRFLETDATSESVDLTDLSLRAWWQISRAWSADAGVTYLTGDAVEALLIDVGLSFRW